LIKSGWGKYCSRECQFKAYEEKRIKLICLECGKEFSLHPSSVARGAGKYCSRKCKDEATRDYLRITCLECGKEFEIPKYGGESSIEKLIRLELEKLGEEYKQEVPIGQFHVDFMLPKRNAVIECDGVYWHDLPEVIERDRRKDRYLRSRGYRVFRFTGDEIRESLKRWVEIALSDNGLI